MISFSNKFYPELFVFIIILISTVSSASIGERASREVVDVGSTFHDEDAKQNLSSSSVVSSNTSTPLSESIKSTTSENEMIVSLEPVVLEEEDSDSDNSTQSDGSDVIYLTYPSSLYPFGLPTEENDPARWLWALDAALQKQKEKEELDAFADELEELYSTELEEEYEEDYDEEDEANSSDDADDSDEADPQENDTPREDNEESSEDKSESPEINVESSEKLESLSEAKESSPDKNIEGSSNTQPSS